MKLYIEGHNHKLGYAVSVGYSDEECSTMCRTGESARVMPTPVRFYASKRHTDHVVERFNSRRNVQLSGIM